MLNNSAVLKVGGKLRLRHKLVVSSSFGLLKDTWCHFVGKQAIRIWQRNEEGESNESMIWMLCYSFSCSLVSCQWLNV